MSAESEYQKATEKLNQARAALHKKDSHENRQNHAKASIAWQRARIAAGK